MIFHPTRHPAARVGTRAAQARRRRTGRASAPPDAGAPITDNDIRRFRNHLCGALGIGADPAGAGAFIEKRLDAIPHQYRDQIADLLICVLEAIPQRLREPLGYDDLATYRLAVRTYAGLVAHAWNVAGIQLPITLLITDKLRAFIFHPTPEATVAIRSLCGLFSSMGDDGFCGFQPFNGVAMRAHTAAPVIPENATRTTSSGPAAEASGTRWRPLFRSPKKCEEFERRLAESDFPQDWALLRHAFPDETAPGRPLLRDLVPPGSAFHEAFVALCWKYCLFGVSATGTPLLARPAVRQTPFGTEISIPAYLSVDFKRDFDLGTIAEMHRARGISRQGEVFSAARIEEADRAAKALAADSDARSRKLRGARRLAHIRQKLGMPESTDDAVITRLLRLAKDRAARHTRPARLAT